MPDTLPSGFYAYLPLDRVTFGRPAAEAVAGECARLGARRVFIVTTRSLTAKTSAIDTIAAALGPRHAGTFDRTVQHPPRDSVLAAADAVRAARPDLIVTVGGGTAIDTVKVLQVCLAHDVRRVEDLDGLHMTVDADGRRTVPELRPSPVRQIAVPTTLSGAEFSNLGAATDPRSGLKQGYVGADIGPRAVVLDPRITLHTPTWLWLSTGIRAVDHAVETLCATDANAYLDGLALHALHLFGEALPRTLAAPDDLGARLRCQQAVWLAGSSILRVEYGASHGIGHALGAVAGVPHGQTSCVLLPHVLRYNAKAVGADRLRLVAGALGRDDGDAAAAVAALVARLGQPQTLRAVGVAREQLPRIAEGALSNPWLRTNPRPITRAAEVMEILEAAW